MSTWLSDMRKNNPNLAADYAIVGNQSDEALRHMVKAMELCGWNKSHQDMALLEAAQRILGHKKRIADKHAKALAQATAKTPTGWDVIQGGAQRHG